MFTYNTTKKPIILKEYGRYIQELINHIAQIDNPEEQTNHIENLLPILNNLKNQKYSNQNNEDQRWADAYIASNYTLNIKPPHPLPENTPIQKTQLTQTKPTPNHFKCCGKHLTALIRTLMTSIEQQPQAKDTLITLAKTVQQIHKKSQVSTPIIPHIEEIAQKKIPFPHPDIEKHLIPRHHHNKKNKHQ